MIEDYQRAFLRLECWEKAGQYKSTIRTIKSGDKTYPDTMDWLERQKWADELYKWSIGPLTSDEAEQ